MARAFPNGEDGRRKRYSDFFEGEWYHLGEWSRLGGCEMLKRRHVDIRATQQRHDVAICSWTAFH